MRALGRPAPEFVIQDVEGKTVKISDLRGKVVVLDVWATWCGPCRAMFPHEREMVAGLQGKPFELAGINIDDELMTLNDFLEQEKRPWTRRWSGLRGWEGGIAGVWDIRAIPSVLRARRQGRDALSERPRRGVGEGRQRAS